MSRKIYAVGLGPGGTDYLTGQARAVLARCTVVAGYGLYLDQLGELLAGKRLIRGAMRQEIARCSEALAAVLAGEVVAVVSGGDAGIYGMAGLLLELTEAGPYAGIEVEVVPGLTSAVAAAALAGAPLMNDFAVLSLSDLLTPREVILRRLRLAAEADLVTALYNPASTRRRELLEQALALFYEAGGDLPVAWAREVGREDQSCRIFRLSTLPRAEVQMTSLLIIGNSETVVRDGRLYCRRGYREKYDLQA